jgi:hypothetical protein
VQDLLTALALALVIEGVLWGVAPEAMRRAALGIAAVRPESLRLGGLAFAAAGVFGVWLVRG